MNISIFGLGYVGTVCAACFTKQGHKVIGVDPNSTKVELLSSGRSPIVEKMVGELVSEGMEKGLITATTDGREAVWNSDISLVCVGTPSRANGSLDYRFVRQVSKEIGLALKEKDSYHLVVIRSTVLPGTTRDVLQPIIEEASGKKAGTGFGLAFNPEFLREATAVADFYAPPKTVVGAENEADASAVASLYEGIDAPLVLTNLAVAEMVKYTDNVFHALKIVFGNEIGVISKALGVDSHEVMRIFCLDTKLNLSPYYLKPGFAYGGSCLPKDLRALTHKARSIDVDVPVLQSIGTSNEVHIKNAIQQILALDKRRISVLGFAFKAGTDDLRESPILELIEVLLGKGCDIKLYDRNVSLARLVGANREFIEKRLPHIASLMVDDMAQALEHGEVIIIGNKDPEFEAAIGTLNSEQHVYDLVRITDAVNTAADYQGICW
jgi:GDP-mannose 6-dehydrogenase